MKPSFDTIQSLQEKMNQEIAKRSQLPRNLLNHLTIKALESASSRLNRIEQLLRIEQYDLVFIGQVGAGKTTSICHLLNLVFEDDVTRKGKKKKEIKEILPTGAGKTTLCEFVIQPDETSFFVLEPYSESELQQIFQDFCEYIWYRAGRSLGNEEIEPLSTELDRATRNIVGLQVTTTKVPLSSETESVFVETTDVFPDEQEDVSPDKQEFAAISDTQTSKQPATRTIDKAVEFASTFAENQFQDFLAAVWERANIPQRTQTKIVYPDTFASILDEKIWLAQTCKKLNVVSLPDIPLPKKITIHINSTILSVNNHTRIRSIVDTKGLDTGQSRPDLKSYIYGQDNALCIFTDRFPAAPGGILPIMETYLSLESQDIHTRSVMFVMPQGEEPEKILTPSGEPAQDWEVGCGYRKIDIEPTLIGRVRFSIDNIVFYDAMRYYSNGNLNISKYIDLSSISDPSEITEARQQGLLDIETDRRRIFDEIEQVITRREASLWDEVDKLQSDFQKIQEEGGLSEADKMLIRMARRNVELLKERDFSDAVNFTTDYFLAWLSNLHTMRLRAINRSFGTYEARSINIYFTAGQKATKMVEDVFRESKDKILARFQDIIDNASVRTDIEPFITQFIRDVDISFNQLVNKIGKEVETNLNDNLQPLSLDNDFWAKVNARFGKGSGYKNAVIGMYADEIEDDVNKFLKQTTERLWCEEFISKILDFFGDEESD